MRSISFVIPLYNEEKRIEKTFDALRQTQGLFPRGPAQRVLSEGLKLSEVIFVDDGSTDATFEKIQKWVTSVSSIQYRVYRAKNNNTGYSILNTQYSVISYKPNRGKGYAIRQGMLESKSDYTLFFDADISTPLKEVEKFAPLVESGIDVIVGTRKNGKSTVIVHQPLYRELLGKIFTQLTRLFLQVDVTDFTCGFKAFSKKAIVSIFPKAQISGWGYDAEILFLAKKAHLSMQEIPVIWSNDERTTVKLSSAIIRTLWELLKIRFYHSVKPALKGINLYIPNIKYQITHIKNAYQK